MPTQDHYNIACSSNVLGYKWQKFSNSSDLNKTGSSPSLECPDVSSAGLVRCCVEAENPRLLLSLSCPAYLPSPRSPCVSKDAPLLVTGRKTVKERDTHCLFMDTSWKSHPLPLNLHLVTPGYNRLASTVFILKSLCFAKNQGFVTLEREEWMWVGQLMVSATGAMGGCSREGHKDRNPQVYTS